ncbi:MAG: hypothetical protein ABW205_03570, partial [Burkholderiales bacterium]
LGDLKVSSHNTTHRMFLAAALAAALVSASFAHAQTTKQSQDMMNKMDANKDGQLSKDEYMKYQEKRFDAMDKDKNKMLSQDEWLQRQLSETDGSF